MEPEKMLQDPKPRNPRAARAAAHHAPQIHENPKTSLLLRANHCSLPTQLLLSDLRTLLSPHVIPFRKKNRDIHPFEDASSLEFFSRKNDAALLLLGSHSKKRPHCLTLLRTFAHSTLDMLELLLDDGGKALRTLSQFKGRKPGVGLRPLVIFAGAVWEQPGGRNKYTLARSLLLDLFGGGASAETRDVRVDVEGLQYVVCFSAAGEEEEGKPPPSVHLRCYVLRTTRARGTRLPRVEVEEMGPRADFRLGRARFAEERAWKEAMRRPKEAAAGGAQAKGKRRNKNVETDLVGDQMGRVHVGRQDLDRLQSRKMKGLKRGRGDEVDVADLVTNGDAKKART